jgi:hypothetical protein
MERHSTVSKKGLHFRYEQVALFKKGSHLEFIALQFATLESVQIRSKSAMIGELDLGISTWTPPGRLTDESMRTASCRELASTFHLRGCTFSGYALLRMSGDHGLHLCNSTDHQIPDFGVISVWKVDWETSSASTSAGRTSYAAPAP